MPTDIIASHPWMVMIRQITSHPMSTCYRVTDDRAAEQLTWRAEHIPSSSLPSAMLRIVFLRQQRDDVGHANMSLCRSA